MYLLVSLVALFASGLTLFSGFGLGTILLPVFAVFFPLDLAIALTAVVHLLNNIFKLVLLGHFAKKTIVMRFGIPSVFAAVAGAYLLNLISNSGAMFEYVIFGRPFAVTPIKFTIGGILFLFAFVELIPAFSGLAFHPRYLFLGGVLSGFFGGLTGNQGALRSAFLMRAGLSKESFVATGVIIACMVDIVRLMVYSGRFSAIDWQHNYGLIVTATLSAFTGAYFGAKLIKKVTIIFVQRIVAVMLIIFSILLCLGAI